MKIKFDFVSNSSSTSFIYIGDGNINKELFFSAIGVDKDSPISELFVSIYDALCSAINEGDEVISEDELTQPSEYPDFSSEVIEKARSAFHDGKKIIIAKLSSDGGIAESFMCMEAFEIISSEFYISGLDNYW